jgi:HPt (histidine-containing phosphotransfer) domain-containing protein
MQGSFPRVWFAGTLFVLVATLALLGAPRQADCGEVPTAILDNYLKIQVALAADKTTGVQAAARTLASDAGVLGAPAARTQQAATRLAMAADLAGARSAFGDLSDAMITLVGARPPGIKRAYCPMVNKYWLQKSAQIENPYYGSEMLRCGEFK